MGLSFITEGAIPYAAADPIRVIPACMVGAGVAGALSMAFNCTTYGASRRSIISYCGCQATGRIYLLALAIGSAVGMVLLTALKLIKKNNA